jgi:hypothetical protein
MIDEKLSAMYHKHVYTEGCENVYSMGNELKRDLIFLTELTNRMRKSKFKFMLTPIYDYGYRFDLFSKLPTYVLDDLKNNDTRCTEIIMMSKIGRKLINGFRDYDLIYEFDKIIQRMYELKVMDIYGDFIPTAIDCEDFEKKYTKYLKIIGDKNGKNR